MNEFKLNVTNSRPIKFKGELISEDKTQIGTGRFIKLALYKTSGGNFVCQKIEITQWAGERDQHFVEICKDIESVVGFFGLDDQAKEIYTEAGIDVSILID